MTPATEAPAPPSPPAGLDAPAVGLADAEGPIPAFGPAATDAEGRVVMTDAVRSARLGAARRTLAAMARAERGGPDDDPRAWAGFIRRMNESKPGRPPYPGQT